MTAWMSIGSGDVTTRSRAMTALSIVPARTASRAAATASRYVATGTPGRTVNSAAVATGGGADAGTGASSMRVTQQRPSADLPITTCGTTSSAGARGTNGSTPMATGPEPGRPT